jgi:hypothetical protein
MARAPGHMIGTRPSSRGDQRCDELFVDIQTSIKCAIKRYGLPPSAWWVVPIAMHEAPLTGGKLTRG